MARLYSASSGARRPRRRIISTPPQAELVTRVIGDHFARFGYEVSFEALDKGAIEILGPYGVSYTFRRLAERISKLQINVHANRRADPIPKKRLPSQEVQKVLEEFWDIMPLFYHWKTFIALGVTLLFINGSSRRGLLCGFGQCEEEPPKKATRP